jgi:AcrR family transcriptional regulator
VSGEKIVGRPRARRSIEGDARPVPAPDGRSAETRRRLLDAAIAVLHESGFANLTLTKTSRRAGLTNGAMQHHFPSRDDLVVALMDRVYPVLEESFDAREILTLPIAERVTHIVAFLWDIYQRPEYLAIWDIALGSRDDPALRPRITAYQRETSRQMRANFAASFADLNVDRAELDRIFSLAVGFLRGLALQNVFAPDTDRDPELRLIKEVTLQRIEGKASKSCLPNGPR